MLDTNIVSELARNPQGVVFDRIQACGADAVCVSVITAAELRFGCAKKGSPRLTAQIETILQGVQVLPFEVPADAEYGRIRSELERAGTHIGPNDVLIGAHACAVGAVLVTANDAAFRRIRNLQVETWLD